MSLPKFLEDIRFISKLADEPNDVGGLSAEELKAEFDKAAVRIQDYINNQLIPKVESDIDAAALGVGSGGGIAGDKLRDESVTKDKLAAGSVTTEKIALNAVTTEKLANGSVTKDKLDAEAVSTDKITNEAITRQKIANQAVTTEKLFPGAVTAEKLASESITAEKIAPGAVSRVYKAEISTNWSGTAAPYTQTVLVEGLPDSDRIIADVILSDDWATAKAEEEAFGKISRLAASAGALTAYAREKTEVPLAIKLVVLHGSGLGSGGTGGDGGGTAASDGLTLIDRSTGVAYTVYVNDGKLTMA